jgi:hypothetical protein
MGFVLEDLGSTNGTTVGSQRLTGPYQLQSGDAFTLGESVTLVYEAVTYDPDATIASPRVATAPAMPVVPADEPPVQPQAQYVAPPPPVYSAPATPPPPQPQFQPQPQPSFAGQVPAGPMPAPAKKKGKLPVWIIILLVLILLVICVCVVSGVVIDQTNSWCKILPFLPGCP